MLGTTVPEPRSDGRIFVCSAGVSPELRQLIRIYPLARRRAPHRWEKCCVPLERSSTDSRGESWKLKGDRALGAHESINDAFSVVDKFPREHRAGLLSPFVVSSIDEANARRLSLAVIEPEGTPELLLEHNPTSPDSPQMALFDSAEKLTVGARRFPFIPRLRFFDEDGEHKLMLREWGAYEFMRKSGHEGLAGALRLDEGMSLLVGNLNNHRMAWCVIAALRGVREQPQLFNTRLAVAA